MVLVSIIKIEMNKEEVLKLSNFPHNLNNIFIKKETNKFGVIN